MDVSRHQFELVFGINIIYRTISNRGSTVCFQRQHLHLLQLRSNLGPAFRRYDHQGIHPHQVVGIRPVSTRDSGSCGGRQRTILRLIRLRTDVDTETRTRIVAGRHGLGDGGGDDDDADTNRRDCDPPPLHRLRKYIQRYRRNRPY